MSGDLKTTPTQPESEDRNDFPIFETEQGKAFVSRICTHGYCVPIIGPELTREESGERQAAAEAWAKETNFPFQEHSDYLRAAESLRVNKVADEPIFRVQEHWCGCQLSDRKDADVYRYLACLPVPLFICSHHHQLLLSAMRKANRDPNPQMFAWNDELVQNLGQERWNLGAEPKNGTPVVFYWHGCVSDMQSLVVTERDHLDFLVAAADKKRMPYHIDKSLATKFILLLGYRLFDLHFHVLLRALKKNLTRSNNSQRAIAVQFVDVQNAQQKKNAEDYLQRYLSQENIQVVLGDSVSFVRELYRRVREQMS